MKAFDRENYGWTICAASFLLLFCTGGLAVTGFTIYQSYLISDLGLSNTLASAMLLFRNLFGMVGMFISPVLIKRFEIRRVVTAAAVLCAAGFAVFGLAGGFALCCVAASMTGLSYGLGGMIPVSILINRWFEEHTGLALGVCMAATGLSATVASPVIVTVIEHYSLQTAFFAEAAFILLAALIVHTMLRSRPDCLNVHPIGYHMHIGGLSHGNFAPRTAPRLLVIWMALGIFIFGAPANTLHPHVSVLYNQLGFKSGDVTTMVSLLGFSLAIGKCVYGLIADKIGLYRASWILYTLAAAGTFCCCLAGNHSIADAFAGVAMMGFGLAVTTVSISMYASALASEADYSKTVTLFQVMSTAGALVSGSIPGIIADITGSYVPAFQLLLVLLVLSACMLQFGFLRAKKLTSAK